MNALLAVELEELEEQEQRFQVETPEQANWALRKIRALQAKINEARELAQAEVDRINQWLSDETGKAEDSIAFFTSLLEEYHRAELERDPKAKTIKLPYGQLQMRAQQPEYIRNDELLRPWVEQNKPEFLIPQPAKLDWAGLKKVIAITGATTIDPETGESIPGLVIEQREPKFSVKVD